MEALQQQVSRVRRRLALQRFWAAFGWCTFVPLVVAAMLVALDRRFAFANWPLAAWLGAAFGLGLVMAAIWTWRHRPRSSDAAVELDRRYGLKERVSSALSLAEAERETPIGQALVADAVQRVKQVDVSTQFQCGPRRVVLLPLIPLAAAILLGVFVPPAESKPASEEKPVSKLDQKAKELLEKQRLKFAEQRKKAEQKGLDDTEAIFKKLEESLKTEVKQPQDRQKALVKLSELAKQIEERQKQLGSDEKMKEQLQQKMKELGDGPADKFAEALRQGDFQKALDELKKLEQKTKDMPADQQKQVADQLSKIKEKLEKLAQDQKAAKQELEKQIQQAQQQGQKQTAEQLQKQLQQIAQQDPQMQALKDLATKLGQCEQCMKQGDKSGAQQKLQDAMQSLEQLSQNLDEMQMLKDAMDQIAQAKCDMCEGGGLGKKDGKQPGQGGKGNEPGEGGDGLGAAKGGSGTRPERETDTKTIDRKVAQQVTKGGGRVVGFVEGPNIKGEVQAEVQSQVDAATRQEADPTTEERLPAAYREHLKEYFESFRKDQ